jgi:hypothetical protein
MGIFSLRDTVPMDSVTCTCGQGFVMASRNSPSLSSLWSSSACRRGSDRDWCLGRSGAAPLHGSRGWLVLGGEDFLDTIQGVDFGYGLVWAKADYAGKS